jgi:hypothetical protein
MKWTTTVAVAAEEEESTEDCKMRLHRVAVCNSTFGKNETNSISTILPLLVHTSDWFHQCLVNQQCNIGARQAIRSFS